MGGYYNPYASGFSAAHMAAAAAAAAAQQSGQVGIHAQPFYSSKKVSTIGDVYTANIPVKGISGSQSQFPHSYI
jgi:hypothetical protein